MMIREMITLFLDSRKRGIGGARTTCSPKTMAIYEGNLREFDAWCMNQPQAIAIIELFRKTDMIAFQNWLDEQVKSERWALASKLQVQRSLKTFLRWAAEEDWDEVDEDDAKKVKKQCSLLLKQIPRIPKNPKREDIPVTKDLKVLRGAFNTYRSTGFRDYVMTCMLIETGARLGELCDLKIKYVNLEERIITVDGKTGVRTIALSKELAQLLRAWLKKREKLFKSARDGSEYVFTSKYGEKMNADSFGKRMRIIRKKCGLGNITAHRLRHRFATNWLEKGGDLDKLRRMLGHSSFEMVKGYADYAKMKNESMKNEVDRLSILKEL